LDEIYDSLYPQRKPFASVRCARSASDRVLAAVRPNDGLRGLRGRREGGTFIRGFLGESFFTARPRVSIQLRRRSANKRKSREIFRRIAGVLGGISLISRSSSGKCRGGPRESRKFRSLVTYTTRRATRVLVANEYANYGESLNAAETRGSFGRAADIGFTRFPVKQYSL